MSEEPKPALSVVVVILAGREYLVRCLRALRGQMDNTMELIVPHDDSLTAVAELHKEFGAVRFIHMPGKRTFAELRSLGFREARGQIIALTEDHCSPAPDWCANILRLHKDKWAAVGGAVDKSGVDTALNWAIYLCDFGRYMQPVPEGPAGYLTDCNVSYKRSAIEPIAHLWSTEFHETTVNWALQDRNQQLLLSRSVVVNQQRNLEWGYALRERYEFGRLFASTRVANRSLLHRAVYAGASFLLPAVLLGRVLRNLATKRRNLLPFVRAFPAILLLNFYWTFGEFAGYITARAAALRPGSGAPMLADPATGGA